MNQGSRTPVRVVDIAAVIDRLLVQKCKSSLAFFSIALSLLQAQALGQSADAVDPRNLAYGDYQQVEIVDLKADLTAVKGKRVQVRGRFFVVGRAAFLGESTLDISAILVSFEKMPWQDRHNIFYKCSSGCFLTLRARVDEVLSQTGLITIGLIADSGVPE